MGGILAAEVAIQPPRTPATGQPFAHRILGTISLDTPFLGIHPGLIGSGIASLFRPADSAGPKPVQADTSGASTPTLETQDSVLGTGQRSPAPSSYVGSIYEADGSSQTSRVPSSLANPSPTDLYFNKPFANDVYIPERKGLNSILHFINKHAEGIKVTDKLGSLTSATKSYFTSHLEFGGCLADYPGMKARYSKLRALEDIDDTPRPGALGYQKPVRRIRFVNYYTASTGRPKQPKIPPGHMLDKDGQLQPIEAGIEDMSLSTNSTSTPIPNSNVEDETRGVTPQQLDQAIREAPIEIQMQSLGELSGVQDDVQENQLPAMRHIDSMPIEEDEEPVPEPVEQNGAIAEAAARTTDTSEVAEPKLQSIPTDPPLPPIPAMPTEPLPIDLSIYTDKDSRKIAEKEHKRITKAYQQALKDRDSAIKDRKKLVERREKKARQEADKRLKEEQKQRAREEKEEEKRRATINPEPVPSSSPAESRDRTGSVAEIEKPKKDRKFCMLPPETNGKRDVCWVRVYMEDVDEVGAHCGLFFPGPQYESLVMDVGRRIEDWVDEDAKRRAKIDAAGS